jgi:hypothetical protein
MDNVWFCKVLLLFQVESNTDLGLKRHVCLCHSTGGVCTLDLMDLVNFEDYLFYLKHLFYLIYIDYLVYLFAFAAWLDQCDSKNIFEFRTQHAVTSSVCCTHYFNIG